MKIEKKETEHYAITVYCGNCTQQIEADIPKGVTIEDWKRGNVCPNCGCSLAPPNNNYYYGGNSSF